MWQQLSHIFSHMFLFLIIVGRTKDIFISVFISVSLNLVPEAKSGSWSRNRPYRKSVSWASFDCHQRVVQDQLWVMNESWTSAQTQWPVQGPSRCLGPAISFKLRSDHSNGKAVDNIIFSFSVCVNLKVWQSWEPCATRTGAAPSARRTAWALPSPSLTSWDTCKFPWKTLTKAPLRERRCRTQ